MAILHDYKCLAHGIFKDSADGVCPHGCAPAMSHKVFLKAPAYHGGRTASIDRTLQGLADDHGLTDMNNQNGTSSVYRHDPNMDKAANDIRQRMMTGQTYSAPIAGGDNAIAGTLAEGGFQSGNAITQVRSLLTPPKPNVQASWNGKD